MAEAGTLAINNDVVYLAGANANSTYTAEAYTNYYIKMAEGVVCTATRYDWVTNYASVSTIGKELLREATATLAATKAIQADMSGYASPIEAQTMVNILTNAHKYVVDLLTKDNNYKDFVLTGAGAID